MRSIGTKEIISNVAYTISHIKKERNYRASLTDEAVLFSRHAVREDTLSVKLLAEKYGVSAQVMKKAVNGSTYKDLPGAASPVHHNLFFHKETLENIRNEYATMRHPSFFKLSLKYGCCKKTIGNIIKFRCKYAKDKKTS